MLLGVFPAITEFNLGHSWYNQICFASRLWYGERKFIVMQPSITYCKVDVYEAE